MDIRLKVPQKWNDLSEWQMAMIGRVTYKNDELEARSFSFLVLVILLIPRPSLRNIIKAFIVLWKIPFSDLEGYTNFIFDKEEYLGNFPKCFRVWKGFRRIKLYGPANRLVNISIDELSYADTFFYKWITERDPQDLDRLVAVLYRPAGKTSSEDDRRSEFNKLLLTNNSYLTDNISHADKHVVALAYQGCRTLFAKRYPHVFPAPRTVTEDEQPKPAKPKKYLPFSKIINAMAMDEVQVFGDVHKTEKANAVKFLEIYEESIIRERRREARK